MMVSYTCILSQNADFSQYQHSRSCRIIDLQECLQILSYVLSTSCIFSPENHHNTCFLNIISLRVKLLLKSIQYHTITYWPYIVFLHLAVHIGKYIYYILLSLSNIQILLIYSDIVQYKTGFLTGVGRLATVQHDKF